MNGLMIDPSKWQLIPLDKLVVAAWNYKQDDPVLEAKLMENMKRNGIIESCIVRELDTGFYEIVNGNHRYTAALKLESNGLFCYNLGPNVTVLEAQRIAIETNETRFQTEAIKLAERMKELVDAFGAEQLAATMPYNQAEIENMAKLLDFNWSEYTKPDEGDGEETESEEYRTVLFKVPKTVYDMWQELVTEASEVLEYDKAKYPTAESRIFELACVELKNNLSSYLEP